MSKKLIQLRVDAESHAKIKAAAKSTGTPVSRFTLYHAMVAANQVLSQANPQSYATRALHQEAPNGSF